MSFSYDVKQELNKTSNLVNKELVKYELVGYFMSGNTNEVDKKFIKYSTESDYNINRFSKLLANLNINHDINILGKTFFVTVKKKKLENIQVDFENVNNEQIRAYIRGLFMGAGSINNPENKYHLEIVLSNEESLEKALKIFTKADIKVKKLITKNKYSLYMKEGEEISKLLALIGANKAVLHFEEIRVQREMRGKVNRIVNCESANLNKTINASIEQIAAIRKLQKNGKFNKLDDNLKEIAILRLENPNMPLVELGKKLKNPIGKSGVNYRLKRMMEIANER